MLTEPVCCNLGHSLPEPVMRDFLSRWIAFWSLARSEIPQVSAQHFPNSSFLLQNPAARRGFVLLLVLQCHHLRIISPSVRARNRPPLPPDISHLEALYAALLSLEVPPPPTPTLPRSAPFICLPQLCSSSVSWLTAEADSGMEGIRWFQLEKLHSFCVSLWMPPPSSCPVHSNTLKHKNQDNPPPQLHVQRCRPTPDYLQIFPHAEIKQILFTSSTASIIMTCVVHAEGRS